MKNRTNWQTVKKFFSLVPLRKKEYVKLSFVSFLGGINGVVHVLFLERVIYFLESDNLEYFQITLWIYISYILLFEITNFSVRRWGWVETEMLGGGDIDREYLQKYVRLDNNAIEKVGTGKLIGIINEGRITWVMSMTDTFMMGIGFLISITFTFFMIGRVNIIFSFAFIGLFFLLMLHCYLANAQMTKGRLKRYHLYNDRLKDFVKVLMSKNEILQSGKIEKEIDLFNSHAYKLRKLNQDMGIWRKLLRSTPVFIMSLVLFGSFYMGGMKVLSGDMTLGALVGITGTIIVMQKSIIEFVNFFVKLTKDFMKIEKMWDFFDQTPELEGYDTGEDFVYKDGNIKIQNMSFGYDDGEDVFHDFDIELSGGKIYAFVGASGGGKTTLAKLIVGYLRHKEGNIIIDGQNLKEVSLKSYYQSIGYLTQEPSVFDGSIIDNLSYAITGEVSYERLDKIIKLSKCEFIYDFKDGLNTEIGEKGVRLSGGQKQRLAIAKIMLKDPKIIILDEPTSALDSFSEEQITYAMNNLFEGRTVIVIAHRLQTVKHADAIFVFENGKVVEQGNHDELIVKKGIYNKMLELQSGF